MRALALLAIAGCMQAPESGPLFPPSCSTHLYFEGARTPVVDLVFVIDDSAAMVPYTGALEANAPGFASLLEGVRLNLRIAVAHGSTGAFVDPIPCGAQPGARFLEDAYHGQIRNFSGSLADALSCMFGVGTDGASPQQILATTSASVAANRDFLRDDAYLFVVMITPQDDASPGDPLSYLDSLNALKPLPHRIAAAVVTKLPAPRLENFFDALGSRSGKVSITQTSWSEVFSVFNPPPGTLPLCFPGPPTDPISCTIMRVQYVGTPMQRTIGDIPLCDPAGQLDGPCAAVLPRPSCSGGMSIRICYNGFDPSNPIAPCREGINETVDGESLDVECAIQCY